MLHDVYPIQNNHATIFSQYLNPLDYFGVCHNIEIENKLLLAIRCNRRNKTKIGLSLISF